MVIKQRPESSETGALMAELLVAIALLVTAIIPLAYSIASEKRLARACYERAVAMEIVDGEMEVLMAGAWTNFPSGTQDYAVRADAITNLTDGKFLITVGTNRVHLEWRPALKDHGGTVVREVTLK